MTTRKPTTDRRPPTTDRRPSAPEPTPPAATSATPAATPAGPVLAAVLADIDPTLADTPVGAMALALAASMDEWPTAATARELRHCLDALNARRQATDVEAMLARFAGPVMTEAVGDV